MLRKMMRRITLIVDNQNDNDPPHYITVDATDRIEIIIDEYGVRARSDGERFDTIEQEPVYPDVVFNNQLELFSSKPWQL